MKVNVHHKERIIEFSDIVTYLREDTSVTSDKLEEGIGIHLVYFVNCTHHLPNERGYFVHLKEQTPLLERDLIFQKVKRSVTFKVLELGTF